MFRDRPPGSDIAFDALPILAHLVVACCLSVWLAWPAGAHDWYTKRHDPVFGWHCCGGNDCAPLKISKSNVTAEREGYRVRLSVDEARAINPYAKWPIDALVPWARVQASETDEWAICVAPLNRDPMHGGIFCFFEPANM